MRQTEFFVSMRRFLNDEELEGGKRWSRAEWLWKAGLLIWGLF